MQVCAFSRFYMIFRKYLHAGEFGLTKVGFENAHWKPIGIGWKTGYGRKNGSQILGLHTGGHARNQDKSEQAESGESSRAMRKRRRKTVSMPENDDLVCEVVRATGEK